MGLEVCKAVDAAADLELVAMIDQDDVLFSAADAGAQVLVDFTNPDAVMENVRWAVGQGISIVVGTSGFTESKLDEVRGLLAAKPGVGVLIAPNFGLVALLGMELPARAAKYFESGNIREQLHPRKLDARSGTSMHTAKLSAEARAAAGRP